MSMIVLFIEAGHIYVSRDRGRDKITCGSESSPCLSIKIALKHAETNDTIKIDGGSNPRSPANYPIKSFDDKISISFANYDDSYIRPILSKLRGKGGHAFSMSNKSRHISFSNITFSKMSLLTVNRIKGVNILIEDCHFIDMGKTNQIMHIRGSSSSNIIIRRSIVHSSVPDAGPIPMIQMIHLKGIKDNFNLSISDCKFMNVAYALRATRTSRSNLNRRINIVNCSFSNTHHDLTKTKTASPISIYGFTINISGSTFNGHVGRNGGAINLNTNKVTISRSNFTNNTGFRHGGALSIHGSRTEINSCYFFNNTVGVNFPGVGGAIYSKVGTSKIVETTFKSNYASGSGSIIFDEGKSVSFEGNRFYARDDPSNSQTSITSIKCLNGYKSSGECKFQFVCPPYYKIRHTSAYKTKAEYFSIGCRRCRKDTYSLIGETASANNCSKDFTINKVTCFSCPNGGNWHDDTREQ